MTEECVDLRGGQEHGGLFPLCEVSTSPLTMPQRSTSGASDVCVHTLTRAAVSPRDQRERVLDAPSGGEPQQDV